MLIKIILLLIISVVNGKIKGNWIHRDDFQLQEKVQTNISHEIIFAIKQNNIQELQQILMSVSDPTSQNYGQHMSHKEVHEMSKNQDATNAIIKYCMKHQLKINKISEYGEYVYVESDTIKWDELLQTQFQHLKHISSNQKVIRSPHYTIPNELELYVFHIFNTIELPVRLAPIVRPYYIDDQIQNLVQNDDQYPCHSVMTPKCWNYYYNMTTNNAKGQSQMIFGQKGYVMAQGDLGVYAAAYGFEQQIFQCPAGGCDGDSACQGYDPDMKGLGYLCVEANLDTQVISGIAQGADNTFYQVQDLETPFLQFITYLSSLASPPGSVSISYGSYEYEMESQVMDQFTTEALKLGLQGVSIISACGDDGVAGYKARNDTQQCKYTATFPSTCPYVTSVGGTQNAENDPEDHEVTTLKEWAANAPEQQGPFFKITTAGGFSNYFPVQSYQKDAIKAYFETPESKNAVYGYNITGRGFPDISTNSINFQIWVTSFKALVQGTSGSAPSIAGMISVINAQRAKTGKPKLGFLNPLLYSNPQIFNDITHGYNNCTAVPEFCCQEGFTATIGWDPLTGLGSPNYSRFIDAVKNI